MMPIIARKLKPTRNQKPIHTNWKSITPANVCASWDIVKKKYLQFKVALLITIVNFLIYCLNEMPILLKIWTPILVFIRIHKIKTSVYFSESSESIVFNAKNGGSGWTLRELYMHS